MAKRVKKPVSPAICPVEAIIWHDAAFIARGTLDTSPTLMHTVGFLVYEDTSQVILAHEVNCVDDWIEGDMDHTKIPVGMILKRTKLGEIPVQQEETE